MNSKDLLEREEVDFTLMWLSTAIQSRAQGVKLINIAQIIQRSALMLVAKKESGIHKPADIEGKKVGLWRAEFQIQPLSFLKKYNVKAKIIPQSYSVNLFLRNGVDVASAMWYNEYHTILNAGLNPDELTTFFFFDHGLNFPEDGIYTLEKTMKKDPDLVCSFARASLEGWMYAFAHPDEAIDIVLQYMSKANVPMNRIHQKWMLDRIKDLSLPKDGRDQPMGIIDEEDFLRVSRELKANGFIHRIPDFESFHARCLAHAQR